MSALLENVRDARELLLAADREWRRALVNAATRHSLSQIAEAAGLSKPGVAYLIRREREENGK